MSLLLPALSALFWSAVVIIDRISLKKVFWTPLQALFLSSIIPVGGFLFALAMGWSTIVASAAWLGLASGLCFMISNAIYFFMIRQADDVDEVAAWDAAPPFLVALLAIPLGQFLSAAQWAGVLLILASLFLLRRRNEPARLQVDHHLLLFVHTFLLAVSFILFDAALERGAYWPVLSFYLMGASTGILVILLPRQWTILRRNASGILDHLWLFVLAEVCATLGLVTQTYAFQSVHPAIATAISGAYPVIIFLSSPLLRRTFGLSLRIFPRPDHRLHLLFLLAFVGGLFLLS